MNDLRMYHERFSKQRRDCDKEKSLSSKLAQILNLLPSRTSCDEVVQLYFEGFEKTMRILHYPSFMDEYRQFWDAGEAAVQQFPSLIPLLAVIVAVINAWNEVSTPANARANSSGSLCNLVEAWMDSLTGRKQLTMSALRTRAILIIAYRMRASPPDEIWKATGNLVRYAMMAGLHRDPSEFPGVSPFEGELRRRLWFTSSGAGSRSVLELWHAMHASAKPLYLPSTVESE